MKTNKKGDKGEMEDYFTQIYIWGGLLTDRLESKHKKLARQIDSILKSTKTGKHRNK
jgi:hypothetical protein